ncbi:unnamed protein product [Ilex paraguariensis]|uniref:SBP-type domain-containing protein n=1 Tax=Ilex paraguariensis TaxID=185542 RepID=A0ABC8UPJ4_9AQUA
MDTRPSPTLKNKAYTKKMVEDEEDDLEEEEDEVEEEDEGFEGHVRKKINLVGGSGRKGSTAAAAAGGRGGVMSPPSCQVEKCASDLTDSKKYHRRHKVCEAHAKAPVVMVAGMRQRFCQQCSRFHELLEFDEAKRSCRRRLAGHNERRRKNSCDSPGEGSNRRVLGRKLKENQRRLVVERGRAQMAFHENSSYGDFHTL